MELYSTRLIYTVIGCPIISGVTCCGQPKCWLTGIGLVTKLSCGQICCTYTPTCVPRVFNTTCCREVISSSLINLFNLSSIKGQFLNSCLTYWQYVHANATSTMGWVVVIGIFCWTSGHSTIPMINTLGQTIWWSGCVCWTTIGAATASTNWLLRTKSMWRSHSKLHRYSN